MSRCSVVALWAFGCGGSSAEDVSGTWLGSCELFAQGVKDAEQYELEYVVRGDRDGSLDGTAVVQAPFLVKPIGGTLTGTHTEDLTSITAAMGDQTLGFELTLEGPLSDDVIEGACATEAATGTGRITRAVDP